MSTWPDSGLGDVPVIGVNAIGQGDASSVAAMCAHVTIPLLQDTDSDHLWEDAGAHKDDVYILDTQRHVARIFSCYDYGLHLAASRDSLREWVREAIAQR